ncbi:O-antigen ligase family protein [Motilimonas sp. KMU-193]|uniref:O-antigen ligase family protein n=1 Tax=Motilimonas sp. KMU-193 TaxID=3388668 RepID=UPI00396B1B30
MSDKKEIIISFLVCLFPIFCLSIGKGYNYGAALLFLWSIWMLKETRTALSIPHVKLITIVYSGYFLSFLLALIIHGEKASYIDQTSRFILALPILYAVVTFRPNIRWVMYSFMIGAFIAGFIALYQTQIQGIPRAFERAGSGPIWWNKGYMPIQSGNMAMSLGVICLCFAFYFNTVAKKQIAVIALIASAFGMLASFLSGSRGGWVFLPFVLIYLVAANINFSKRVLVITLVTMGIVGASIAQIPQVQHQLRIDQAIDDIQQYQDDSRVFSSIGIRFELFKSAILLAPSHLTIGISVKDRIELRREQVAAQLVSIHEGALNWHSHNQYLEALSLRGVIGLAALLALFTLPIYIFSRNKSPDPQLTAINQAGISSTIMLWGYGLSQVFIGHNSGSIFTSIISLLFMGISISLAQKKQIEKQLNSSF